MRKEVLFAVVAGGALGLVIAFAAWKSNLFSKPKVDSSPAASSQAQIVPTSQPATGDFKIVLVKPANLSVSNISPIALSGITRPNAYVVISSEENDEIIKTNDSGSVNSNVDLTGGTNLIIASAYDAAGNETSQETTVIYSSQYQIPQATDSGKVYVPQAYVGTVTDITDSVIQIKASANGEIEQITATNDASYVDTRNNASKLIKSTDIAIGDYLIALGIKNGNNILSSSRIIVSEPLTKTTRRAFFGIVTDDSGMNKFVAKNSKSGETMTITPAIGVTISGGETSFGKIVNDEKVIVAGEFKDGTIDARTIQVLE